MTRAQPIGVRRPPNSAPTTKPIGSLFSPGAMHRPLLSIKPHLPVHTTSAFNAARAGASVTGSRHKNYLSTHRVYKSYSSGTISLPLTSSGIQLPQTSPPSARSALIKWSSRHIRACSNKSNGTIMAPGKPEPPPVLTHLVLRAYTSV